MSSTITAASAPAGIGAPVMMRSASPAPTSPSNAAPAANVPTIVNSTGAPAVSAARTAYPSTAVLRNGGTSSAACTSSTVTRPSARAIGSVTASSRWQEAST